MFWRARFPRRIFPVVVLVITCLPVVARSGTESTSEGIRFFHQSSTASQVSLAGDFNGWNATANPMTREGDMFSLIIQLGPGEHEYKFVVDGNWGADPDNPTTVGSYGNSVIRVGASGELLEMEATSNTTLSPKILLNGRYIGLFMGREDENNQNRFSVDRPDFNIDLNFDIRVSEVLKARVLTKLRNAAEETPLWETSLRFDRGHLDLQRDAFAVRVFDNDGIGNWDDPLHLVGDIGRYSHEFGFEQQGVRVESEWRDVRATFVYADNFDSSEPNFPEIDSVDVDVSGFQYDFNLEATNKNVLALRLQREWTGGLRIGGSLRNDRGYNPGSLNRVQILDDSTSARQLFDRTNEGWIGGGIDAVWESDRWVAHGEILYGEASIRTGDGMLQTFRIGEEANTLLKEEFIGGDRIDVDISQRWIVGARFEPDKDVDVSGALEYERHGLSNAATDSSEAFRNWALVYRAGFNWDLAERYNLPVRAGFGLEVYDFSYPERAPWDTQIWFADRNFWMEHDAHRLPVARYVQLGGQDAATWTPRLEVALAQGPPITFRYEGRFRAQEIDQEIELWESYFELEYPVTRSVRFFSQTRWARYQEPTLDIHSGYVSTFAEVEYKFLPTVAVSLSYGVDPFILDLVTNEYDEIGINEFLVEAGAAPNVARDRYQLLSSRLPAAEQMLENERRIQLEAILTF